MKLKEAPESQARQDLEHLLRRIQSAPELENYFKTRETNINASITTYEKLWTCFAPKTRVIAKPFMNMPQVLEVSTSPIPFNTPVESTLEMWAWCWDWNGKKMVRAYYRLRFDRFRGTKPINDLPFYPFASQAFGEHPHWVPAFLVRNEEWKDSVQLQFQFVASPSAAVAGPLGTGAAGTTLTFTAYGSGTGTPTLDVYSLPIEMGLTLKDQVLPGVLSRVTQGLSTPLQSAGTNVVLLNMQKQSTPRVFIKTGVGTVPPIMSSLTDTNITAIGILLGSNRNVRNVVDWYAHKALAYDDYQRPQIQGYLELDFMDSGDPDSSYPGQNIGDGSTFALVANIAGVANGQAITMQEQILHTPTGALYTY